MVEETINIKTEKKNELSKQWKTSALMLPIRASLFTVCILNFKVETLTNHLVEFKL